MTDGPSNTSPGTYSDPARGPSASAASPDSANRSFGNDSFDDEIGGQDPFGEASFVLELGKEWVRQHQTVAMIGAFAVGAFVGALMRD